MINEINQVKNKVKNAMLSAINEYYHCKDFRDIACLKFYELSIDSLDEVEMIMTLEEKLEVEIPDSELTNLEKPLQLFRLLVKKLLTKEQLLYLDYVEKIENTFKGIEKGKYNQEDGYSIIRDLMVSCSTYAGNTQPIMVYGHLVFPMTADLRGVDEISNFIRPTVPVNNCSSYSSHKEALFNTAFPQDDPKRISFAAPEYHPTNLDYKGVSIKTKEGNKK